jgi:NADPH:quinone reductase-like Zn-dependent oxidoreductase
MGVADWVLDISVVAGFEEPEEGKPKGVKSMFFVMDSRGEELEAMGGFVERGLLRGAVDSVWKVEEFEKAFEITAGGHAKGKVVFKMVENEE